MPKSQKRVVLALFCAVLLPVICYGQSTFGDVRGTAARDAANLAIPQVVVTLHNVDENGGSRGALSDANGGFLFENLQPGKLYPVSRQGGVLKIWYRCAGTDSAPKRSRGPFALGWPGPANGQRGKRGRADQYRKRHGRRHQRYQSAGRDAAEFPRPDHHQSARRSRLLSPSVITDSQGNIQVGGATYSMTGYSVDGISTADVTRNGSLVNAYPSSEGLAELKVTAFNNSAELLPRWPTSPSSLRAALTSCMAASSSTSRTTRSMPPF